jgi:hypothetical protein
MTGKRPGMRRFPLRMTGHARSLAAARSGRTGSRRPVAHASAPEIGLTKGDKIVALCQIKKPAPNHGNIMYFLLIKLCGPEAAMPKFANFHCG